MGTFWRILFTNINHNSLLHRWTSIGAASWARYAKNTGAPRTPAAPSPPSIQAVGPSSRTGNICPVQMQRLSRYKRSKWLNMAPDPSSLPAHRSLILTSSNRAYLEAIVGRDIDPNQSIERCL